MMQFNYMWCGFEFMCLVRYMRLWSFSFLQFWNPYNHIIVKLHDYAVLCCYMTATDKNCSKPHCGLMRFSFELYATCVAYVVCSFEFYVAYAVNAVHGAYAFFYFKAAHAYLVCTTRLKMVEESIKVSNAIFFILLSICGCMCGWVWVCVWVCERAFVCML